MNSTHPKPRRSKDNYVSPLRCIPTGTRWPSRIAALVISACILTALYMKVDRGALTAVLQTMKPFQFIAILMSLLGVLLVNSVRWQLICRPFRKSRLLESFKQISAANSLDTLVPMKMGSLSKSFILYSEGNAGDAALGTVVYEKLSDAFGASLVYACFFFIRPVHNPILKAVAVAVSSYMALFLISHLPIVRQPVRRIVCKDGSRFLSGISKRLVACVSFLEDKPMDLSLKVQINAMSILLWLVQGIQFYLFFKLLDLAIPFTRIVTGMMAAFFTGMLPVSFMGMGIRDLAIVRIFDGSISYEYAIVLGMLCFARTLLPALIGLFFLQQLTEAFKGSVARVVTGLRSDSSIPGSMRQP